MGNSGRRRRKNKRMVIPGVGYKDEPRIEEANNNNNTRGENGIPGAHQVAVGGPAL